MKTIADIHRAHDNIAKIRDTEYHLWYDLAKLDDVRMSKSRRFIQRLKKLISR